MKKKLTAMGLIAVFLMMNLMPAYAADIMGSTRGAATAKGYSRGGSLGQAYIECTVTAINATAKDNALAVMTSTGVGTLSVQPIVLFINASGIEVTYTPPFTVRNNATNCSASQLADNPNGTFAKGNFSYNSANYGTFTIGPLKAPF